MKLRVGCEFQYTSTFPTPVVVQVQPRVDGECRIIEERWDAVPATSTHDYRDVFGNRCRRLVLPQGESSLRYDALVEVADRWDPTHGREAHFGYVTIAVGREYWDVAPTSGTFRASYPGTLSARKRVGIVEVDYVPAIAG